MVMIAGRTVACGERFGCTAGRWLRSNGLPADEA
jgi:hypothetical protein